MSRAEESQAEYRAFRTKWLLCSRATLRRHQRLILSRKHLCLDARVIEKNRHFVGRSTNSIRNVLALAKLLSSSSSLDPEIEIQREQLIRRKGAIHAAGCSADRMRGQNARNLRASPKCRRIFPHDRDYSGDGGIIE